LNPDLFAENKQLFVNLTNMVEEEKRGLLLNTDIPKPRVSDGDGPVEEKRIKGSQPLKESFERFLDNLQSERDNANLEPYRISLLDSLGNINDALDQSFKPPGVSPVQIDTGYPQNYIAYDFGWKDNPTNTTEGGEWSVKLGSKNPPDIIQEHITNLTDEYQSSNDKKQMISNAINDMIELLQFEESTAEKSATPPGSNDEGNNFRETQESFKPNLKFLNTPSGGGYKKKSKSKKMTSKRTSMKVAKKTSSKEKENKNKNKKIVKSYSKSKSKKQSGGFIRGGVLFPQDFYDTSTVM
jgi:hypothetical protein